MISGTHLGAALGRFGGPKMGSKMVKMATWRPKQAVQKLIEKGSGRKSGKKGQRSGNRAGIGGKRGRLGRLLKGLEGEGAADLSKQSRARFQQNCEDNLTRPAPLRGAADLTAARIPPSRILKLGKWNSGCPK